MMRFAIGTFLLLASASISFPAVAQTGVTPGGPEGEVSVLADQIEQVGADDLLIATGNVEITRGNSRLSADRVEYNRKTGDAVAVGRVIFYDGQDQLVGDRIDYNFRTGTGVVHHASAFSEPYYRVTGELMERVGERVYQVRRGVFTTCEADPPEWAFHAGTATVDLDEQVVGRDASFWVGRIPLIPWIPFFSAPIRRDRQTGFLFPQLGNSSTKGFFAKIPFFWAISDSQDLTLSVDTFSKRGVGLFGEYRYLLSASERGSLSGFFIRETLRDPATAKTDEDRGYFSLKHTWQISPRLSLTANVNRVSDNEFFRNYGDRLAERSLQRVQSNIFLAGQWHSWSFTGSTLWYQDLTTPFAVELQRLPELRAQRARQSVPGAPWLLYEVESSFVNFVREVGSDGRRLDFHPRVSLPISVGGYFTFTPFVGGRETFYDTRVVGKRVTRKEGIEVEVTKDDPRIRTLGELGADVETSASRIFDVGGVGGISRLQHLIEPRVNVTEIQGVNEKGVPQFDPGGGVVNPSGLPLADLGIDRLGRVARVTYSLTNRLNAKTVAGAGQEPVRWELARFVLSQVYELPPTNTSTPFSDLRGDLIVQPNRVFRFRGDAGYNVYGLGVRTVNTDITAAVRDVSATVGTRFSDPDKTNFVRGELKTKVSRYLDFRGSSNWDVRSGAVVESRFGVDVHLQCWAFTLEFIDRARNEDEFRFTVNLLGLGGFGTRAGVGPAP